MAKAGARRATGVALALLLACCAGAHAARQAAQAPAPAECAAAQQPGAAPMSGVIQRAVSVAEQQAFWTTQRLQAGERWPVSTLPDGSWELKGPGHWMSGMFAGVLWQLHALTGKQLWADKAQLWQAGLAGRQREFLTQHDLGFIYLPSFAHSYSVTHSLEDKRQALAAAEALSWAFNPNSKSLRTFEGWSPRAPIAAQQVVIIDFMMNIHMLVWGAKHVGEARDLRMDADPAATWLQMAVDHARQVQRNHVREDGTTFHIVEYNPFNGDVNRRYTYQGYADNSTWSRGQAWAMAGFSMLYEETGLPEFRDTAVKVTDKYLQLLAVQEQQAAARRGVAKARGLEQAEAEGPYDRFVPLWDFDAPFVEDLDGPRDTSGAAVAALAMLHLARALGAEGGAAAAQRYLCAAVATLRALASPKHLAAPGRDATPAVLKHATGGMPFGEHINVGLITADYYFLSALSVCASWEPCRTHGVAPAPAASDAAAAARPAPRDAGRATPHRQSRGVQRHHRRRRV